jgi:hypothetical protein
VDGSGQKESSDGSDVERFSRVDGSDAITYRTVRILCPLRRRPGAFLAKPPSTRSLGPPSSAAHSTTPPGWRPFSIPTNRVRPSSRTRRGTFGPVLACCAHGPPPSLLSWLAVFVENDAAMRPGHLRSDGSDEERIAGADPGLGGRSPARRGTPPAHLGGSVYGGWVKAWQRSPRGVCGANPASDGGNWRLLVLP